LDPLLVNTVVGFIGPEYLYDGRQIVRAGLEDHFCGKLLGLPMGVDVCYTNHAEADADDMDTLLTLLAAAGAAFVITVPGGDDVMLGYQSLSFHDALYARALLGLRPAPEFESWLAAQGLLAADGRVLPAGSDRLRALAEAIPAGAPETRHADAERSVVSTSAVGRNLLGETLQHTGEVPA
jgi:ethanolamine ammonia-lyase large subunit